MKLNIPSNVTRSLHKVGFTLKKYSPEILAAVGVVGTVTSTVMACKATTKVSDILDSHKDLVDAIHIVSENPDMAEEVGKTYSEEDSKKDLTIAYVQTGLKLVKLYAPSVILGTLSISAMLTSNNILRKRNAALVAAYTTVDRAFKAYRGRVVERFGEELDRELRYNIKAKEVEKIVTDDKGKEKVEKETVDVIDSNLHSDYARFYDDGCLGWEKDPELNLMTLNQRQHYANDILKSRGHLFLNEVYDMLGIPRTKAGNVVGWIYDEKNPIGDNYVDFGIFEGNSTKCRDFVNGYERVILLDFNVDGPILDMI